MKYLKIIEDLPGFDVGDIIPIQGKNNTICSDGFNYSVHKLISYGYAEWYVEKRKEKISGWGIFARVCLGMIIGAVIVILLTLITNSINNQNYNDQIDNDPGATAYVSTCTHSLNLQGLTITAACGTHDIINVANGAKSCVLTSHSDKKGGLDVDGCMITYGQPN